MSERDMESAVFPQPRRRQAGVRVGWWAFGRMVCQTDDWEREGILWNKAKKKMPPLLPPKRLESFRNLVSIQIPTGAR